MANETRAGNRLSRMWSQDLGLAATRSLQILIVGALALVGLKMLLSVQLVVIPVIIALILASAMWPVIRLLRHKVSDMLAATVVLIGAALILGGIGTGLFFTVKAQSEELSAKAVEGFGKLREMASHLPEFVDQKQIDELVEGIKGFLTSSQFGAGAISGLSAAGTFLTGLVLTFVILFFFLKDGDKIWRFFLSWLPKDSDKRKWQKSGVQTVLTLGDYVRGTAIVAAVDALGIGIGLFILQVPLALPLAVIVFIGAFIPMVGATAAGIIAALVALVTNGLWPAVIVVAVVYVVNQVEGTFLQPVVMSRTLSLHGLVVLTVLTAGTVIGGLTGAVLSVPLAASAWAILKIWTNRQTPEDERKLIKTMASERLSRNPQMFS